MDAFLLVAAGAQTREMLVGGVVRAADPAGALGLWLELVTPAGPGTLLLAAEPALPRLVCGALRPPKVRPLPPLAGAARQCLPGSRLAAVVHAGLDRLVRLRFEPAHGSGAWGELVLEAFGAQPNLLLLDAGGVILEAARHTPPGAGRPQHPGAAYVPPAPAARPDPRLLASAEAIAPLLEPLLAAGLPPAEAVRQGLAGLSDLWAQEVAAGAADDSALALARCLARLLHRIETGPPAPRVLLDEAGRPQAASPVPLAHLPESRQRPTASLADAVEQVAGRLRTEQERTAQQAALRQLLRRIEERLRTRRAKLTEEAAEFARADEWQRLGEILVAHQGVVPRGASEAALPDYAAGPEAVARIPLDPALPAGANAERLFQAARRGRRGALRVADRLAETDRDLARLEALAPRARSDRPEDLDTLRTALARLPHLLGPRERAALATPGTDAPVGGPPTAARRPAPARPAAPRRKGDGPEPRRFVSSEGLPILVGRDNESNDHLTLHLARSEDLWLHAEGFPGSHVVIRMRDRTGGVPRQTLVEAAKLAAYYSQARSHGKVSVSYTVKKYVHKPRKSPPGLVTVTHEKTIVVTPDKELVSKLAVGTDEER